MTPRNGNGRIELAAATAEAAAAGRVASTIIGAFDVCEQSGAPLSQLQKVALLETALMEFDGLEEQLGSLLVIEDLLKDGGRSGL